MSTGNSEIWQLKDIISNLEETLVRTNQKNAVQIEIFHDYVKIFQKQAQKLALLSNKINEQILSAQGSILIMQMSKRKALLIFTSTLVIAC